MSNLKQQILGSVGLAGLYTGIIALAFSGQLTGLNAVSIAIVLVIFVLSALITSGGKSEDPKSNAQKFILATTVQMLVALFYVLFAKVLAPAHFKGMSIHFLALFFLQLVLQAVLLVRQARSTPQ